MIPLKTTTRFILSTSGSEEALQRHNQALAHFDSDLAYFTFKRSINAEEYAHLLSSPIVRGGAVTGQGLKTAMVPFMTKLNPLASKLGAINTVVNVDGALHGYNTDAHGFRTAIANYVTRHPQESITTAVVYGYGGVSGVAVSALQELGFKVSMTGRNNERVEQKMAELKLAAFDGPYDLVVNATPASCDPVQKAEGLVELLRDAKLVFDHSMPEKEGKTNYIQRYCHEHSIDFISGNDMYIPQMIQQWGLFLNGTETQSGKPLSVDETDIKDAWKLPK